MKACGQIVGSPAQIEILHDEQGAPHAHWEFLRENHLHAEISLSSSGSIAVAVAVVTCVGRIGSVE